MIILFGPAGSGKSTQGKILADKFGWRWLSVGQVLRETGRFDKILKEGGLVDDMEVIRLMNREIDKADADGVNVVLDGYPRDIQQGQWMDENNFFDKVDLVIIFEVPKGELWKRIEERGRNDDTKDVVERRFDVFEQNICSILPLIEKRNIRIVKIDGVGNFDIITKRLVNVINDEKLGFSEVEKKIGRSFEKSYGE